MAIEIAGITLNRIHRLATMEQADFVWHRVPGLDGELAQDLGRASVRLRIEGICYGPTAADDLDQLREAYKNREPVDFLAEIVGQAYFSQVVLARFEVRQAAPEPEQFSYLLEVAEFVPPPQPVSPGLDAPGVDLGIELDALNFMDMIQIPDLLSLPGFGDPTEPLQGILEGVKTSLETITAPARQLADFFE